MKQLLLVVCVLVLSAQSVVSSTQQTSSKSQYSSFWEYLLEQEKTLMSFTEGKIWSDCSKLKPDQLVGIARYLIWLELKWLVHHESCHHHCIIIL